MRVSTRFKTPVRPIHKGRRSLAASAKGGGFRTPPFVEPFVDGSDMCFQACGDTHVTTCPVMLVPTCWGGVGRLTRRWGGVGWLACARQQRLNGEALRLSAGRSWATQRERSLGRARWKFSTSQRPGSEDCKNFGFLDIWVYGYFPIVFDGSMMFQMCQGDSEDHTESYR